MSASVGEQVPSTMALTCSAIGISTSCAWASPTRGPALAVHVAVTSIGPLLSDTDVELAHLGNPRNRVSSHSGRDGRPIRFISASPGEHVPSTMAFTCSAMGISTP